MSDGLRDDDWAAGREMRARDGSLCSPEDLRRGGDLSLGAWLDSPCLAVSARGAREDWDVSGLTNSEERVSGRDAVVDGARLL